MPHCSERNMTRTTQWPLWEVFIRSRNGLHHQHVGSVHAVDAEMAVENARDVYTRRGEGVSIWVVPSASIVASEPADKEALFEPALDKVYCHPTFSEIPEGVANIGAAVVAGARRRLPGALASAQRVDEPRADDGG